MKKLITIIFVVLFTTAGCAQQKEMKTMTVAELQQKMKSDSTLVVLDVRTPPELSGELGHIDGVINIPVQVLDERINELEKYKDRNIAVICRSGHRSKIATEILLKNGYKAINVLGGMRAYSQLKK
jgi:rhodanese-related sulfurtransferase